MTRRKVSSDNPILKPQVVNPTSDNGSFPNQPLSSRAMAASIPRMEGEGEENQGGASLSQSVPPQGVELGGVWLHRQQEDEEQRGEDSEGGGGEGYDDSEDERTTCSEDSMPSTPLPQLEELTFFDPLSPSGEKHSALIRACLQFLHACTRSTIDQIKTPLPVMPKILSIIGRLRVSFAV